MIGIFGLDFYQYYYIQKVFSKKFDILTGIRFSIIYPF